MADFLYSPKEHAVAVVLFLSNFGQFSELHFCQFASTAFDGVGCLRTPVFVLFYFLDIELFVSSGGVPSKLSILEPEY